MLSDYNLKYVIESFIDNVTVQSHSDMCDIRHMALALQCMKQVSKYDSVFHTQFNLAKLIFYVESEIHIDTFSSLSF